MTNRALLLIDFQEGLSGGPRNNPAAEDNAAKLLAGYRRAGLPVIHVRHDSTEPESALRPGLPGNQLMAFTKPLDDEVVFSKSVNSAFIGTDLEALLKRLGIERLVIIGATTDHCVSTSIRMAENLGFAVTVAADACFTFDRQLPGGAIFPAQTVHDVELSILSGEFAEISTVEAQLAEIA